MKGWLLSKREVAELTRTPQRARQAAFLRQNGIRHYLDAHGWPVVLRSAVEPAAAQEPPAQGWVPNKSSDAHASPRAERPRPPTNIDRRLAAELARQVFAARPRAKRRARDS